MRIVRMICDRCYREDIEDDADDWYETKDGLDLCDACTPPRYRPKSSSTSGQSAGDAT